MNNTNESDNTNKLDLNLHSWTQIITILTGLAAIIGGFFALYQYTNENHARRINQVLSLEKRFSTGHLLEKRKNIDAAWLGENFSKYDEHIEKARLGGAEWINHNNYIIDNVLNVEDLLPIVDFYSILYICIKNKLCDATTAIAYFKDYITRIFTHHTIYICRQRTKYDPSFSNDLIRLYLLVNDNEHRDYEEFIDATCKDVEALAKGDQH